MFYFCAGAASRSHDVAGASAASDVYKVQSLLLAPSTQVGGIHFPTSSAWRGPGTHDILLCLQTGKKLSDTDRMRYEGGQYFVKSEEEMKNLFPYALEALENTQKIADRCHVEIEFGVTKLPKYDVPDGYTSWEYLQKLCHDGLVSCLYLILI